jgi:hypothetical protein
VEPGLLLEFRQDFFVSNTALIEPGWPKRNAHCLPRKKETAMSVSGISSASFYTTESTQNNLQQFLFQIAS